MVFSADKNSANHTIKDFSQTEWQGQRQGTCRSTSTGRQGL